MSHGAASTSGSTSASLLLRAKAHDANAWSRLSDLYAPLVYRWSRRGGLQASDARDVSQEVFRSVAEHLGDFRHDPTVGGFRGWLWTITRNKIRDHFRSRAGQPVATGGTDFQRQIEQLSDAPPEDSDAPNAAVADLVRRALDLMKTDFEERTWQAFWLTTVEEQSPAEAAKALGIPVASVYQAKSRVLRRLRQELSGLTDQ